MSMNAVAGLEGMVQADFVDPVASRKPAAVALR